MEYLPAARKPMVKRHREPLHSGAEQQFCSAASTRCSDSCAVMERNPKNMNPQIAPFLPMEAKLACGFITVTKFGNAAFQVYEQRTIIAPPQTALSVFLPSGSCLRVRISLIHDCTCATQGFPLH